MFTMPAPSPPPSESLPDDALIRLPEVEVLSGLKRSQIYDDIGEGLFPAPTKIGTASRWSRREVQAWIRDRLNERGRPGA